jgi:hypothetical protein
VQRPFDAGADHLRPAVGTAVAVLVVDSDLGGDDDLFADRCKGLAD